MYYSRSTVDASVVNYFQFRFFDMETHQESPRSVAEEDHKSITRKRSIATALDAAAHETCASGPVTKLPHLAPNLLPQYAEWTEWLKHRTVVFDINNQQPVYFKAAFEFVMRLTLTVLLRI